jgi:hypothetical protein
MISLNMNKITKLKADLAQLTMENRRLTDRHSDYKKELGELTELANKWRIRACIAEKFAQFLNKRNPFWRPEDLEKEIDIHQNRLFKRWENNEPWWLENGDTWLGPRYTS